MIRIPLIIALITAPILTRILLYVAPFIEKERQGIVCLSRITFLFFPLIVAPFITLCLSLNIIDFIGSHYAISDFGGVFLLSLIEIGLIVMLVTYKITIIEYDDEKLKYRNKVIYYSDIESYGYNDNYEVYITNEQYKIKISRFAVGSTGLYKTFEKARKLKNKK